MIFLLLFDVEDGPFSALSFYFIFHFLERALSSFHFIAWVVVRGARGEEWGGVWERVKEGIGGRIRERIWERIGERIRMGVRRRRIRVRDKYLP